MFKKAVFLSLISFFNHLSAESNPLFVNLFAKSGNHVIAEFIQLSNDTLYFRMKNPDSSHIDMAEHKTAFSKVMFFSGEHLNLELSYFDPNRISAAQKDGGIVGHDTVASSSKTTIAVTDFEPRGGVSESDAQSLSDRFRERMVATASFRVMERNEVDIILREQGFQQTGACRDNECLVEMGQLIAVQKIISGSIGKVGSIYTISAKLLNIATGAIDKTVSEDCDCPIEQVLTKSLDNLARKMAGLQENSDSKTIVFSKGDAGLFIKSTPEGAQIFIDGKRIEGTTPITINNIVAGDRLILIKKTIGEVEWTGKQVVRCMANEIVKVKIALSHEQTTLQINTVPAEAEIYIDKTKNLNYFPKYRTPVIIKNVPAGVHTVSLFKSGYIDTTVHIDIKPYMANEINIKLVAQEGPEKVNLQNTFTNHRLQRRLGKWTLLASLVGTGLTSYFAYESLDNRHKAEDALDQLKKPEVRNDPYFYNYWTEKNSIYYYDYRFNHKAFLAALGATLLTAGIGLTLYF